MNSNLFFSGSIKKFKIRTVLCMDLGSHLHLPFWKLAIYCSFILLY